MNSTTVKSSSKYAASELAKIGMVTALYITVTFVLTVISFNAIQLRLSEMFNYLAIFHKRYVIAVTLGVVIANLFSPMWVLDVPIGGIGTLLVLLLCRFITKYIHSTVWKFIVTGFIFTLSMFTVATQLYFVFDLPFWPTYALVAFGELLSMTIGGIIVYMLNKKIDFSS